MRAITLFSTQSNNRETIQSSAATWGELKGEVSHMINGDMKATVKETKNDLSNDDAILPEGAFTLFLFPNKVKSGTNS
tara:strand:- start:990 stop:1223 length:234 start_codon:yes stop_codon:yes gene_type:complete